LDLKKLDLPFELRPYQVDGVKFLTNTPHALLGDDMGLGKTIQAIASLKLKYQNIGMFRCLIIVPNSLVTNWLNEFSVWFPNTGIQYLQGDATNRLIQLERSRGFLVATYDQIRIAYENPNRVPPFEVVILDEAQKIKNTNSQTTLACNLIKKKEAWLLSGTPLENNQSEILSVFSFMNRKIIRKGMEPYEIRKLIAPYMLRRLKKEILDELPDLIEQDFFIELSPEQRKEYDLVYGDRKSEDNLKNPLPVINKLKQICNFSTNLKSTKLDRLIDICKELEAKEEKIIVFSQYVKSLERINDKLFGDNVFMYHGGLDKDEKDTIIKRFKAYNGHAILLMSIKAGSVGLNLQEASTVVLFDRNWNPAIEKQAIARAHRMGRKEPVHAIKFIVRDSIEERINDLLIEKNELFEDIIEGAVKVRNLSKLKDILEI
jgi:SNF2 family DNA or RNA helicase